MWQLRFGACLDDLLRATDLVKDSFVIQALTVPMKSQAKSVNPEGDRFPKAGRIQELTGISVALYDSDSTLDQ